MKANAFFCRYRSITWGWLPVLQLQNFKPSCLLVLAVRWWRYSVGVSVKYGRLE